MPEKETIKRARKAKRQGKAASTQAGEFVHAEIDKIRHGEHGARSPEQAIAIGLSEARRAGVDLPPPKKGKVKESTRKGAERDLEVGRGERKPQHRTRVSRAVTKTLQKEPRSTVSKEALSQHAKRAAAKRKRSGPVGSTSKKSQDA